MLRRCFSSMVGKSLLDAPPLRNLEGAVSADSLFLGKKVVCFGLPGAFTPVCTAKHLPEFIKNSDKLKSKGVDEIVCVTVNDAWVTDAWAKSLGATPDSVRVLADPDCSFTKALGQAIDLSAGGLGWRGNRFAYIVRDGVVEHEEVEATPNSFDATTVDNILSKL